MFKLYLFFCQILKIVKFRNYVLKNINISVQINLKNPNLSVKKTNLVHITYKMWLQFTGQYCKYNSDFLTNENVHIS